MNGSGAHPLYKYLKQMQPVSLPESREPSQEIEWNYTKFLLDSNGIPVRRYRSRLDPLQFEGDVRLLLAGRDPTPTSCLRTLSSACDVDSILGEA